MNRHSEPDILPEGTLTGVTSSGAYAGPCVQYTVMKGDTLTKIAHRYGSSINILVQLNQIPNRKRLYVGQVLLIPALVQ
ncbi:MAG: LysM domain-containing protein [Clostridia bacterium]